MPRRRPSLPSATRDLAAFVVAVLLATGLAATARGQSLDDPLQGFVSIEPYEIRQTFVVHLPVADPTAGAVVADQHTAALAKVEEFIRGKCQLTLDDRETPTLEIERSEFIRTDATLGIVTDDREVIPAGEAFVAVVLAASRPAFPDTIRVDWDLFPESVEAVPFTVRTPSASERFTLTPQQSIAKWKIPEGEALPSLEELPLPPLPPQLSIPLPSIGLGLLALIAAAVGRRLGEKAPPALGLIVLGLLVVAAASWKVGGLAVPHPFEKPPPITAEQADEVTYALLINLYHAFDYRDEEAIYDTLATSVAGDLLEQIYLEIRRSLTLEDQGGAKVRIKNVDLRRCLPSPLPGDDVDPRGFRADCEWVAIGDVTHWAHTHTRLNRYAAELDIAPVDGEWKLTSLQILEEFSEVQQQGEDARGQKSEIGDQEADDDQ